MNGCKRWFKSFRSSNIKVEDETRSGRPIVENVDEIIKIGNEADRNATISIANKLKISQKIWNHLRKSGLKKKLDKT